MVLPVQRSRGSERWRGTWPSRSGDPFAELAQMWDRMGRFFEPAAESGLDAWTPIAETEEAEDAYLVRAELPGMKREDVQIELSGNELCISGEVDQEQHENTLKRRSGRFSYRMSLPSDADTDNINARMNEGILTVRLPKSAQARSRRIEISG